MLVFNNLTYYAIPSLPEDWNAPKWLTIELGIFAGRLYFDFDEYDDLRKYMGLKPLGNGHQEEEPLSPIDGDGLDLASLSSQPQGKVFTSKPLQFLQDWLAARRRGQDFSHTPMGHVCQDKPLDASHAFFAKTQKEQETSGPVQAGTMNQMSADQAEEGDAGGEEDGVWGDDGFDEEAQEGGGAGEVVDWDEEEGEGDEGSEESEGSEGSGGSSSGLS